MTPPIPVADRQRLIDAIEQGSSIAGAARIFNIKKSNRIPNVLSCSVLFL
jgi:hypothetical protein